MLETAGGKPKKLDVAPGSRIMSPREANAYGAARSRRSGNQAAKTEAWKRKQGEISNNLDALNDPGPTRSSSRSRAHRLIRWTVIIFALFIGSTILSLIFDR